VRIKGGGGKGEGDFVGGSILLAQYLGQKETSLWSDQGESVKKMHKAGEAGESCEHKKPPSETIALQGAVTL